MVGFKKVIAKVKGTLPKEESELDVLCNKFIAVKSLEDGLNLLHKEFIRDKHGLTGEAASTATNIVNELRGRGFILESNFLARAVPQVVIERKLASNYSVLLSGADSEFKLLIAEADSSRDQGDFGRAEYYYWSALQLYPAHAGYMIQYAHSLKEQGKLLDAGVNYLDAFYYGAEKHDVLNHLLFVANDTAPQDVILASLKREGSSQKSFMGAPLSSQDVRHFNLLLLSKISTPLEIMQAMFVYSSREEYMLSLLDDASFAKNHRDFLQVIAQTNMEAEV